MKKAYLGMQERQAVVAKRGRNRKDSPYRLSPLSHIFFM
jgi:hypothetical protein